MKRRILSILMTLCMVVSLLPASVFATEGAAQITGFSVTVDGVTYTEGDVAIKPDSTVAYTVTGTNLDKLSGEFSLEHAPNIKSFIGYGYGWDIDDTNTSATRDFSDRIGHFVKCEKFELVYSHASGEQVHTGIYLTYDDGSTEADKAEVTGISLVVDGQTYTEGHVSVRPESDVLIIVHGNYLRKADENLIIDTPGVYVYVERMTLEIDGTCSQTASGSWFAGGTNYSIVYTNDAWATTIDSGITVTCENEDGGIPEITDLAITVDGVTYTEGNVIIRPDSTVSFTVIGNHLRSVDQKQIIDTPMAYLPLHSIPLQEDGTYLYTTQSSVFAGATKYNITYTNDAWATSVATDIFVTYKDHDCAYGDWFISKQPTLTSPGEQYRACSVCGETETETLEMLVGKVSRWNVVFEEASTVAFYLQVSEQIESTAKVQLTIGEEMQTYDIQNLEKNEEGYYILNAKISAVQMRDAIAVTVTNGADIGSTATYTAKEYCQAVLADETLTQYHALAREMLNYGAMAQVYFDYNADNLANTYITDAAKAEVSETTLDQVVLDEISGLDFYGATLVCLDGVAVRYYFTGDVSGLTFTVNGNAYTPVAKDKMHYIEISDILPKNLDQKITLTVTDAEGNTMTVSYSPMNYIVRMNAKGDDGLKNLLKALYNYHLAAKAQ